MHLPDALQAAGQVHAQILAPMLDQLMCKPDAMLRLLTRLLTSIKSSPLTDAAGLNGRLHALDLIMQSQGMLCCLVSSAWENSPAWIRGLQLVLLVSLT